MALSNSGTMPVGSEIAELVIRAADRTVNMIGFGAVVRCRFDRVQQSILRRLHSRGESNPWSPRPALQFECRLLP